MVPGLERLMYERKRVKRGETTKKLQNRKKPKSTKKQSKS